MPELTIDKNYKNTISASIDALDKKYAKLIDVDTSNYDNEIKFNNEYSALYKDTIRECNNSIVDFEAILAKTKWYQFGVRDAIETKIQENKEKIEDRQQRIAKHDVENMNLRIAKLEKQIASITKKEN